MGIKDRLEEQIYGAHRKRGNDIMVGTVLAAYYDKFIDDTSANPNVMLDIAFINDTGGVDEVSNRVPLLKIGGISQSLPPIGAMAVILSIGGNENNRICVGYLESGITEKYISDDKTPTAPPNVIFK